MMRQVMLAGGVPSAQGEESVGENTFGPADAADEITSPGVLRAFCIVREHSAAGPCTANIIM